MSLVAARHPRRPAVIPRPLASPPHVRSKREPFSATQVRQTIRSFTIQDGGQSSLEVAVALRVSRMTDQVIPQYPLVLRRPGPGGHHVQVHRERRRRRPRSQPGDAPRQARQEPKHPFGQYQQRVAAIFNPEAPGGAIVAGVTWGPSGSDRELFRARHGVELCTHERTTSAAQQDLRDRVQPPDYRHPLHSGFYRLTVDRGAETAWPARGWPGGTLARTRCLLVEVSGAPPLLRRRSATSGTSAARSNYQELRRSDPTDGVRRSPRSREEVTS